MKRVCLILLFVLTPFAARAQETTLIPTVIKATGCDGSSAELVSSFKKAVVDSKGYRVVANLSDDGKNDKVMTVGLVCGERNNSVGVAFAYGMARCFGPKDCHAVTDGTSVGILMCDPKGEMQCGVELFKTFAVWVHNPRKTVGLE